MTYLYKKYRVAILYPTRGPEMGHFSPALISLAETFILLWFDQILKEKQMLQLSLGVSCKGMGRTNMSVYIQ